MGRFTIPPGTACFLEIGFNGIGDIHMDHKPDIRFVDPHPKCVGSNYHPGMAGHPFRLLPVAGFLLQSCMIVIA